MTHDEMIEAVAQSMRDAYGVACGEVWVKWTKADESKKNEWRQMARAAIRLIAPAVERETLDRAATEAWSTMNGAVGLCECADCVSQNIRAMKTRYEQ